MIKIKKIFSKIYSMIILIIIIVLVITAFLMFLDYINIKEIVHLKSNNDWMAYFGSVIGGFITLFGVILTIKYESKKSKEEQSVLYRPIFEPVIGNDYKEGIGLEIQIRQRNFKENETQKISFVIKNKGRGEATDVSIIKKSIRSNSGLNYYIAKADKFDEHNEIIKDGYVIIDFYVPNRIYTKEKKISDIEIEIELYIKYYDMFKNKSYEKGYSITISSETIIFENEEKTIKNIKYYGKTVHYGIKPKIQILGNGK